MSIELGNLFAFATAGLFTEVDAVFPSAGEVLDGIEYGPTGTEFTGTFGAVTGLTFLDVASALVYRLGQDADVAGLVGTRIYPERAPQNARFPYLIVSKRSAEHEHHLTAATGQSMSRVEVTLFSETPGVLHDAVEQVRRALDGFRGTITSGGVSLVVGMLHVRTDSTEVVFRSMADDKGIFVGVMELEVWHELEVPIFA